MEGELRDDQWALIAPYCPRPNRGAGLGLTIGRPLMAFSGSCALVPGGETSPGSMAVPPPATAASRNGKTRGCGSISGSPFWVPWTNKVSWIGAKLFWMVALSQLKRGRGHRLWLERQRQHGAPDD
jgi:hypothetical protein